MRTIFIVCVSLLITSVAEADAGFGASLGSDDSTIYVPVTVSERIMVEPYLSYSRQKARPESGPQPGATRGETTTIGLGIFGRKIPAEHFSIYYGARLSHRRDKHETSLTDFNTGAVTSVGRVDVSGNTVAPTLGFQYNVLEHFTIGAEVAVEHSSMNLKSGTEVPPGTPAPSLDVRLDNNSTTTQTNIVLRYFF